MFAYNLSKNKLHQPIYERIIVQIKWIKRRKQKFVNDKCRLNWCFVEWGKKKSWATDSELH